MLLQGSVAAVYLLAQAAHHGNAHALTWAVLAWVHFYLSVFMLQPSVAALSSLCDAAVLTPPPLRRPKDWFALAKPAHQAFLAVAQEAASPTASVESVLGKLATTTQQCVTCHAACKLTVAP